MNRESASPCETLAERYQALLEVAQAISAQRDLDQLFHDLAHCLPRVVQVNYVDLSLHDPIKKVMRLHTIQANVPADLVGGHEVAIEDCPAGLVWENQQPLLVSNLSEERRWPQCHKVTIGLPGAAESLNVAAAGAIALYELARR